MSAKIRLALVAGACLIGTSYPAFAQSAGPQVYYASQPDGAPPPQPQRVAYQQPANNNMGGGFIQFLFGGGEFSGVPQENARRLRFCRMSKEKY